MSNNKQTKIHVYVFIHKKQKTKNKPQKKTPRKMLKLKISLMLHFCVLDFANHEKKTSTRDKKHQNQKYE